MLTEIECHGIVSKKIGPGFSRWPGFVCLGLLPEERDQEEAEKCPQHSDQPQVEEDEIRGVLRSQFMNEDDRSFGRQG